MKLLVLIFTLKNIPVLSWSSFDPLNLKPKSITLVFLIIGLILCGLGETILIAANAGVSPWTVLAQGISVVLLLILITYQHSSWLMLE